MKTRLKLISRHFIKSNSLIKSPVPLSSSYALKQFASSSSTDDINDLVRNEKDEVEKRNIHLKNIINHKKQGVIYQEEIGPDARVVYVADPASCAKIFREGMSCPFE